MSSVEADRLSLAYGDHVVLDDISVTLNGGEFTALIGPSGCGKSTFLMAVAGLLEPTAGQIRIGGAPVDGPGAGQAVVFQSFGLMPWKTAAENVAMGLRFEGRCDRRTVAERTARYLALVGLDAAAGRRYPYQLSGGMQQRVGIARALAVEPDILLMDEPLAAIDAQNAEILREEMRSLVQQGGRTVVLVTHNLDEALFLADRVLLMTAGPGRIARDIRVRRPEPGEESDPAFLARRTEQRHELWSHLRDEVARSRATEAAA